jgi:hypothetical protein
MFLNPDDAIKSIEQEGFNWRLVREYFRFSDQWLSEGEYGRMLEIALAFMGDDDGRNALLDMLDLEYAVFLEQVALQEQMLGKVACEDERVAFSERVMAYLQINANNRPRSGEYLISVRSALLKTPPRQLIHRLLGGLDTSEPMHNAQDE